MWRSGLGLGFWGLCGETVQGLGFRIYVEKRFSVLGLYGETVLSL